MKKNDINNNFYPTTQIKLWRDKATQVYLPAKDYFLPKLPEMINFVKIIYAIQIVFNNFPKTDQSGYKKV